MLVAPYSPRARAKARYRPREDALSAGGQPDTPEDVVVGEADGLGRPGQRLVERLKCAARRPVHERKDDDGSRKNGRPPGHRQLQSERLEEPHADRPLRPEDAQQQIAHDRGRQDERQREDDVEHAFYEPRRLCNEISGKHAEEKDDDGADSRDTERIPQRVQIHSDSEGVSKNCQRARTAGLFTLRRVIFP